MTLIQTTTVQVEYGNLQTEL